MALWNLNPLDVIPSYTTLGKILSTNNFSNTILIITNIKDIKTELKCIGNELLLYATHFL